MDFVGVTLVAGAVTCLVLALQWGGNMKPWGDKAVIIVSLFHMNYQSMESFSPLQCFIVAVMVAVAFVSWEIFMGEKAMVPVGIFKSRSMYVCISFEAL